MPNTKSNTRLTVHFIPIQCGDAAPETMPINLILITRPDAFTFGRQMCCDRFDKRRSGVDDLEIQSISFMTQTKHSACDLFSFLNITRRLFSLHYKISRVFGIESDVG